MFRCIATVIAFLAIVMAWMMYGVSHQFMPDNNLWRYDNLETLQAGKSEAEFNAICDLVQKQFSPIFAQMGETFIVEKEYRNSTVNAWAMRQGKKATVHFYGGLYRNTHIGVEGFMLVASHEVAHLIAHKFRKPIIFVDKANKMSIENVSDVVGQEVFMRNLIEKTKLVAPYFMSDDKCKDRFTLPKDISTCTAQLAGGQQVANLFASMDGEDAPDYDHLDRTFAAKTNMTYANTRCRLTSYYYGAMRKSEYPSCWYKP